MTQPSDVDRLREQAHVLEEKVVERTRLLMRAKRTWEATFDAIGDPLAIVDDRLLIVRTNLALAGVADVDVRRTSGQPCHAVMFGRQAPCDGCPARRALDSGEPQFGEVVDPEHGRVFRMSAFLMQPDVAEGPQVVCHYKDVTEEKALQRQLRQTEKMVAVGTLAGGVAHEINNPLGAIQAFAQLALLDVEPGSSLHEYLTEIERSTHRCQHIVRSLLDFSRPSRAGALANALTPGGGERRPVALVDVVERVLFLLNTQYRSRHIAVVREFAESAPFVVGDSGQLEQVAMNLLGNAFQALEGRGGTVRAAVEVEAGVAVRLLVSDNGPGIDPRHVDQVFEPFFTTKPEGKGTGLGLSITYSIVKDHGATIEVQSQLDEGATFTVSFPWSLTVKG